MSLSTTMNAVNNATTTIYEGIRSWLTKKNLIDGGWAAAASIPFVGQIEELLESTQDDYIIMDKAQTAIATIDVLLTRELSDDVCGYLSEQRAGLQDIICSLQEDYWSERLLEIDPHGEFEDDLSEARADVWRKLQVEDNFDMQVVLQAHLSFLGRMSVQAQAV